MTQARPDCVSTAVKVPHHGSEGAHHDGVWAELVDAESIAIVTPWRKGGGFLPLPADLDRLRGVAGRVYLTASPILATTRKDSSVEKFIRIAGVKVKELRGWGHVRARRSHSEASWRVDLSGDARQIE